MKTNLFNLARNEAKQEFYSLNQAVKSVIALSEKKSSNFVAWLTSKGLTIEQVTVKNISANWHGIKIDGKLGYSYTYKGVKTDKVKTRFTYNDVLMSLSKMGK